MGLLRVCTDKHSLGMTIRTFLSKILSPNINCSCIVSYFLLTRNLTIRTLQHSEQYSAFQLIKKGLEKIWGTLSQISIWALMIGFMLYALLVWTKGATLPGITSVSRFRSTNSPLSSHSIPFGVTYYRCAAAIFPIST